MVSSYPDNLSSDRIPKLLLLTVLWSTISLPDTDASAVNSFLKKFSPEVRLLLKDHVA